mgnify:CR=1 FL=1
MKICIDCKEKIEKSSVIVDRGEICKGCFEKYKQFIYDRSKNEQN